LGGEAAEVSGAQTGVAAVLTRCVGGVGLGRGWRLRVRGVKRDTMPVVWQVFGMVSRGKSNGHKSGTLLWSGTTTERCTGERSGKRGRLCGNLPS
jgi:hypothetical protein